jgi:hypothetical protein
MKKLKIYLDTCFYNRPFDDQTDEKIHIETEAIVTIFKLKDENRIKIIGSEIIDYETENITDFEKKMQVSNIIEMADEKIYINDDIEDRAKKLVSLGFKPFDALHIAASENQRTDFFITTDIKLLNLSKRLKSELLVTVNNPIEFIKEIFYG